MSVEAVQSPTASPTRWARMLALAGRVLPIVAPIAYLVALAISIADQGLPLARDQLFWWLGLGMAAFSVARWRSWGVMLLEWLPLLALLVAYDYLRGAVSVATWQAHVDPQIAFDKFIGFGQVPTVWLQEHLWHGVGHLHVWDYGIWCVYMSHFFTIWIVAAVLWRGAADRLPPQFVGPRVPPGVAVPAHP